MVKRLRRRPLTAKTGVRVPVGLPIKIHRLCRWIFIFGLTARKLSVARKPRIACSFCDCCLLPVSGAPFMSFPRRGKMFFCSPSPPEGTLVYFTLRRMRGKSFPLIHPLRRQLPPDGEAFFVCPVSCNDSPEEKPFLFTHEGSLFAPSPTTNLYLCASLQLSVFRGFCLKQKEAHKRAPFIATIYCAFACIASP